MMLERSVAKAVKDEYKSNNERMADIIFFKIFTPLNKLAEGEIPPLNMN